MRTGARAAWAVVTGIGLVACALRVAAASEDGGWRWLVERLVADGLPRDQVEAVFRDPRMEPFDGLRFSLWPRESSTLYRGHLTHESLERARRCHDRYRTLFEEAAAAHGVAPEVLAAIVHVESACGRNTGSRRVLPALARLAMANEPATLAENIAWHTAALGGAERAAVEARARDRAARLEEIFYPEVVAAFDVARRLGIHPLELRGSNAGAFGMPQFLPRSYLRYGADGNRDGVVDLYDPADAIHSAARYLAAHGWHPGLSRTARRDVVWAYNRSEAYIDAVLGLADRLATGTAPRTIGRATARPGTARDASGSRRPAAGRARAGSPPRVAARKPGGRGPAPSARRAGG